MPLELGQAVHRADARPVLPGDRRKGRGTPVQSTHSQIYARRRSARWCLSLAAMGSDSITVLMI